MTDVTTARIICLLLFPGSSPAPVRAQPPALTKSPPYFLEVDTTLAELGSEERIIDGIPVQLRRQLIDGQVQAIECSFQIENLLDAALTRNRDAVRAGLRAALLEEARYSGPFVEEYTIVCIDPVHQSPEAFVLEHSLTLALWMRTHPTAFTQAEADKILVSRAQHSEQELTVVDWEGALIIAAGESARSDIELLKLANYQILRYRLLDHAIERNLEVVRSALTAGRRVGLPGRLLREVLEQRLQLLLEFERIEQTLLLIGDWYTSQLYRTIADEFYLNDWKTTVRQKLDQLESIIGAVRDNLMLTWQRVLELVQLAGWLLLLIGYVVLFVLDLQKRKGS